MGCNYFSGGKIVLKTTLAKVCVGMMCKRGVLQCVHVVKDISGVALSTCSLTTGCFMWGDTHLRSSRSSRPKRSHFTLKKDSGDNLAKLFTIQSAIKCIIVWSESKRLKSKQWLQQLTEVCFCNKRQNLWFSHCVLQSSIVNQLNTDALAGYSRKHSALKMRCQRSTHPCSQV